MSSDLIWLSANELLKAYRKKKLSPVEVTQAVLARIEDKDKHINAFCLVDGEQALLQAKASEKRWAKGNPRSSG